MSEDFLSELHCIHNVGNGIFGLHGLLLCVSEGHLSELLCVHNVDIKTFDLHGLTLHDAFQKIPL